MCRLKSGIILKDRIFVPEYDSHTKMLEELGIEDNYLTASKTFVRFELSPEDNDVFSSIDDWELNIDQDIIPDWYDEEIYKPQIVKKVKEWAKDHIHIGIDNLNIESGVNHYIKDCRNVCIGGSAAVKNICGNTTVKNICDSARVKHIFGSATVSYIGGCARVDCIGGCARVDHIGDDATVKCIGGGAMVKAVRGSAKVENIFDIAKVENIFDSAKVKNIFDIAKVGYIGGCAKVDCIGGNATVDHIGDNAMIIGSGFGWNNKDALIISGNATFKDCGTKTIYQSGDWKFINVERSNEE